MAGHHPWRNLMASKPVIKRDTLRAIGQEITVTGKGERLTNEELLHRLLWKQALGYEEESRDENGLLRKMAYPPDKTIQKLILEQLSGRPGTTQVEDQKGLTATGKVSQLAKDRVNALIKKPNE